MNRNLSSISVMAAAAVLALSACSQAMTAPSGMDSAETAVQAEEPQQPANDAPLGATSGAGLASLDEGPRTYRIIGTGDIMMGSDWPQPGMDSRITPSADPAAVLGTRLVQLFAEADVVFGNFEGTLHSSSANAKRCGNPRTCYVFRSPPFHAEYLRRAGFTLMSNANNHSRDFGETGRRTTYNNLTNAGIAVAGADVEGMRIGYQEMVDGRRFALVAFGHNPGLLPVQNYSRVASLVRQADAQADVVIVSCHIGAEGSRHNRVTRQTEMYLGENRGNPFRFARAAVDAGADVVFCHGPHIPRAVEVYQNRFIAYSLGNFWTYGRFNLNGHNGLAPIANIEVDAEGALVSANIVSARQDRPGGPYFDANSGAAQRVSELTARDFSETGTRVDASGRVSWPGQPQ